jgi:hypothetical protein
VGQLEYFSIYSGSALLIGRIEDVTVRQLIVQTYTNYKALMDTYRFNSQLVTQFQTTTQFAQQETLKAIYEPRVQTERDTLLQYAHVLKSAHDRQQGLIDRLVPALRAEIRRLS